MEPLTNTVEELYRQHHREIVRFFTDHLADREAAWDLCHDVFLRLLLAYASKTRISHPRAWLMRVAKNLLIDTYRHQQIARAIELSPQAQEDALLMGDATTFKVLLERKDMLQMIVNAFHALPEKYRRLLFWREIERLPLQELVVRTGTTEAVLSTELWRARKLLQKEYQRLRFKDLLPADEEIFEHLDALLHFQAIDAPENDLKHLESHVRGYFERIAPTWDTYVASAYEADLQERFGKLLPWHQGMTVLDAGTGTGYLAGIIAPLVGNVIGVDCSPAMLKQAGEKMAQAGFEHVTLREGMGEQLPLATDSVDVATCHMLLHHVVSPRLVLRELCRVVRPGGYIVIIDAHTHSYRWTPEAFGDLHYGTNLRKLRQHLRTLHIPLLETEDAGISYSGLSIGNDATFSNFLLVGQVGEQSKRALTSEQIKYWKDIEYGRL
ncbi:sigma-70 family RNA polymerase sigma factor [Ktedonospora formicarum]|uniref:Sigma-70 family RNA polymerase sigma factor n=1 Tax=Ktedonospora formicarum TaxID=2778364 RepID=A0A8J3HY88_9CHLR|nr:sigma-70 family RNA polymerase sigma factor [Ktedonospora formicarum]GHO45944.1 hypothetical protein KSX_41070 [Ktedonospora formicarum]